MRLFTLLSRYSVQSHTPVSLRVAALSVMSSPTVRLGAVSRHLSTSSSSTVPVIQNVTLFGAGLMGTYHAASDISGDYFD